MLNFFTGDDLVMFNKKIWKSSFAKVSQTYSENFANPSNIIIDFLIMINQL